MLFDTIAIVGVGLIGGSVGRAVKARGIARRVMGSGMNPETEELAISLGIIDGWITDQERVDLLVVCTPVDDIASTITTYDEFFPPGTIVTDVGSTKSRIAADLEGTLNRLRYIGSHPLAGSERSGMENSRDDLFDGKTVVVVPGDELTTQWVEKFWRALGSRTQRMTAEDHDRAMAYTSHLPHAMASAIARTLPPEYLPLAASGFRDTTRIASGNPEIWEAIFKSNPQNVLEAVARFRQSLDEFEARLRGNNRLSRWLDEGKQVRDALGS